MIEIACELARLATLGLLGLFVGGCLIVLFDQAKKRQELRDWQLVQDARDGFPSH